MLNDRPLIDVISSTENQYQKSISEDTNVPSVALGVMLTRVVVFLAYQRMAHDSRMVWQQCSLTKFRTLMGDRKLRLIVLFGQPAAEPRSKSEVNITIRSNSVSCDGVVVTAV